MIIVIYTIAGHASRRTTSASRRSLSDHPLRRQVKRGMEKGGQPHFTKHGNHKFVDLVWFTCPSPSV